jgi:hypothetical protein
MVRPGGKFVAAPDRHAGKARLDQPRQVRRTADHQRVLRQVAQVAGKLDEIAIALLVVHHQSPAGQRLPGPQGAAVLRDDPAVEDVGVAGLEILPAAFVVAPRQQTDRIAGVQPAILPGTGGEKRLGGRIVAELKQSPGVEVGRAADNGWMLPSPQTFRCEIAAQGEPAVHEQADQQRAQEFRLATLATLGRLPPPDGRIVILPGRSRAPLSRRKGPCRVFFSPAQAPSAQRL